MFCYLLKLYSLAHLLSAQLLPSRWWCSSLTPLCSSYFAGEERWQRRKPAILLYKKLGFKEVPIEQGVYKRANIKMEMELAVIACS